MANKHVLHLRSSAYDGTTGKPKLPDPDDMQHGEIAINFSDGRETLSIKNSGGKIATFTNEVMVGDSRVEIDGSANPNYKAPAEGSGVEIFIDESIDPVSVEIYSKSEIDTQVAALGNKDDDLQEQINSLGDTTTSLSQTTNQLTQSVENLENSVGTDVQDLIDDIDNLQNADTNINERIDNLITVEGSGNAVSGIIKIDEGADSTVEVYSKANVDALFAKLIQLNPSLVWN